LRVTAAPEQVKRDLQSDFSGISGCPAMIVVLMKTAAREVREMQIKFASWTS
jgi:hypothetical protein